MPSTSIIVSPVMHRDHQYTRYAILCIKKDIMKVFSDYGATHITCHFRRTTETSPRYDENYAIIEFSNEIQAKDTLKAIERGSISIGGVKVTEGKRNDPFIRPQTVGTRLAIER